jgi:phosphoribosylformylglycinamidine synthase
MIELEVAAGTSDETLKQMCEQLLANLVIEDFAIEKLGGAPSTFVEPA